MVESFVAVPLIWLGVSAYVAVPIAATVLGYLPFVHISFRLYRKGHKLLPSFVLASYLSLSWQWDILTSIPRGLIGGMPFAVYGSVLLGECQSVRRVFMGSLLSFIGIAFTTTAAVIVVMGAIAFLAKIRNVSKAIILAALGGFSLAVAFWALGQLFYVLHPENALHPAPKFYVF